MAQKYSRQREEILSALCARTDHPTAEDMYLQVRDELPHISLGTVYRNLSMLSDEGEILRIRNLNGPDRFDGCTQEHYHFVCTDCGKMRDLELSPQQQLNERANSEECVARVDGHALLFYGQCSECAQTRSAQSGQIK